MRCTRKHCRYQVPDELFFCPKCGLGPEEDGLVLEPAVEDECEKMHDDDWVMCYHCGYEASARAFSRLIARQQNLVTCPTCKGKGMIPRSQ